jgi:hypothetical protein
VQRLPVHAHVLLRKHDARLEAVVGKPLQRVHVGVAVAHDGEPQALEAVVEVLKGVFVDVQLGGIVVGMEILLDAFLKTKKKEKKLGK